MNLLIDDVKSAWRYLSVQLAALLALVASLWPFFPEMQQYLDPAWVKYVALAILVARVIRQKPTPVDMNGPNDADSAS